MTRPPLVERWRAAILRDRRLHDAPRVLALVLADAMDAGGYVSVDRVTLVEALGVYRSRVDERISALQSAGWLVPVRRPAKGRPAVWQAVTPNGLRAPAQPVSLHTGASPAQPVSLHTGRTPAEGGSLHTGRTPAQPVRVDGSDPPPRLIPRAGARAPLRETQEIPSSSSPVDNSVTASPARLTTPSTSSQ